MWSTSQGKGIVGKYDFYAHILTKNSRKVKMVIDNIHPPSIACNLWTLSIVQNVHIIASERWLWGITIKSNNSQNFESRRKSCASLKSIRSRIMHTIICLPPPALSSSLGNCNFQYLILEAKLYLYNYESFNFLAVLVWNDWTVLEMKEIAVQRYQ